MERKKVRIISFTIAAFVVLAGAFIYQFSMAQTYKNYIINQNARSFYDFMDSVKTIDSSLEKGIHSSSDVQLITYSSEIWREAGGAQANLSQLPLSSEQTSAVAKFLSQTGDYAYTLAKKVAAQEEITKEEQDKLEELSAYCKSLSASLVEVEEKINRGEISIMDTSLLGGFESSDMELASTVEPVIEQFADYPTLIYDGPFSDHLSSSVSPLLENAREVTIDEARSLAAYYAGVDVSQIQDNGTCEGKILTYCFKVEANGNVINIDITKKGGYLSYILNSRLVSETNITAQEAVNNAIEYLNSVGIANMKPSYYMISENVLTANFAWERSGIIYYRDLVKVSVAMDTGEIIGVECTGYLKNHNESRAEPVVNLSQSEASDHLSERLTVQSHSLAVIPTDYGTEIFCHEFLCTNADGRKYLVYINDETGEQEQIFMLIESENGTLTV